MRRRQEEEEERDVPDLSLHISPPNSNSKPTSTSSSTEHDIGFDVWRRTRSFKSNGNLSEGSTNSSGASERRGDAGVDLVLANCGSSMEFCSRLQEERHQRLQRTLSLLELQPNNSNRSSSPIRGVPVYHNNGSYSHSHSHSQSFPFLQPSVEARNYGNLYPSSTGSNTNNNGFLEDSHSHSHSLPHPHFGMGFVQQPIKPIVPTRGSFGHAEMGDPLNRMMNSNSHHNPYGRSHSLDMEAQRRVDHHHYNAGFEGGGGTASHSSVRSRFMAKLPSKRSMRAPRMRWTSTLHAHFVHAVELLGGHESMDERLPIDFICFLSFLGKILHQMFHH